MCYRAELAQHLISEANRLTPSVKYHFQQGLHSVKFDRQEATLQAEDGSRSQVFLLIMHDCMYVSVCNNI